jgi:MFS transporter, putative metabolite transport protein
VREETLPSEMGLKRIVGLCAAGGFLDGYDLLIMSAALLLIVPQFHLKGRAVGVLAAIPFLAMAIGALAGGRLCDTFGRRKVYLFDVIAFLIFAVLQALAQNLWQLAATRFCVGFAIGVDMPTGSSMLAEFSPSSVRGALTSLLNTAWLLGGCAATVVGYVLYRTAGPSAWRWMFAAAAIPAAVIAVARHGLSETPYWHRAKLSESVADGTGFDAILRSSWRRPVAFFATYWMLESFAGGPPFIYTALIFRQVVRFEGADALLLSAVLLAFYAALSLLLQFTLLERWGRKPFAATACALAAIGALATAFLPRGGLWLIAAFSLFAIATQMSVLPFWPWSVELLPTRLRATGQSIGSAAGKLGICLGVLIFSPSVIAAMGWTAYFLLVAAIFLALVVFVWVVGPETKGSMLAE